MPNAIEFCRKEIILDPSSLSLSSSLYSGEKKEREKWRTKARMTMLSHFTGNPSTPILSLVSPFPRRRRRRRPLSAHPPPPRHPTRTISNRVLPPKSATALIHPQTPSSPSRLALDRKCRGPPVLHRIRTSSARGPRNSTSPGTPQRTPAAVTTVILMPKSLPLPRPSTSRQQQQRRQRISRNGPKLSGPVTSAGQKR